MKKIQDIAYNEMFAISTIINEIVGLALQHKKKFAIFIIVELWIHSLCFQHLGELKNIYELIPFIH